MKKKKPPTNLIRRKYRKIVGFNIVANFAVVEFIQCLHKTPSIKRKHKRTHIQIGVASNGEFIDKRGIALHLWIDYTKTIDTEDLWQYYCYYSIPKNVKKRRRKKNILILWIKILFGVPSKFLCDLFFFSSSSSSPCVQADSGNYLTYMREYFVSMRWTIYCCSVNFECWTILMASVHSWNHNAPLCQRMGKIIRKFCFSNEFRVNRYVCWRTTKVKDWNDKSHVGFSVADTHALALQPQVLARLRDPTGDNKIRSHFSSSSSSSSRTSWHMCDRVIRVCDRHSPAKKICEWKTISEWTERQWNN